MSDRPPNSEAPGSAPEKAGLSVRSPEDRIRILFLCTGNSCRSQMAEGWAHALKSDRLEAYSAGIESHGLNPDAVRVMAEAGVNISDYESKLVDSLAHIPFDVVVTVCAHADESCPSFPGGPRMVHVGFDDPPGLARDAVTREQELSPYRRVRDEIRAFVETLPGALGLGSKPPPGLLS